MTAEQTERRGPRKQCGRFRLHAVAALVFSLLTLGVSGQTSSSESFILTLTPTSGTVESSSETFRMTASINGAGLAGEASSKSYRVEIGGTFVAFPTDDDDADSVSNQEEASIRGGDGNGDSIPDQLQPGVASISGISVPVTAEIRSGDCGSIAAAAATTAANLGPSPRFGFPHDLLHLRLRCEGDGAEAVIRLLFHTPPGALWPPDDVRAFGVRAPDFEGQLTYFSLPAEATGITTVDDSSIPFVDLRLTDGMYGDTTAETGVIEVTCGPAWPLRPIRR